MDGRVDIGLIHDTIIIEQIKERGDRMKITISVDNGRTLDFTDVGETTYMMEVKDHKDVSLAKVRVSKADIRRIAKAS